MRAVRLDRRLSREADAAQLQMLDDFRRGMVDLVLVPEVPAAFRLRPVASENEGDGADYRLAEIHPATEPEGSERIKNES